jgi:hypothetical protein
MQQCDGCVAGRERAVCASCSSATTASLGESGLCARHRAVQRLGAWARAGCVRVAKLSDCCVAERDRAAYASSSKRPRHRRVRAGCVRVIKQATTASSGEGRLCARDVAVRLLRCWATVGCVHAIEQGDDCLVGRGRTACASSSSAMVASSGQRGLRVPRPAVRPRHRRASAGSACIMQQCDDVTWRTHGDK